MGKAFERKRVLTLKDGEIIQRIPFPSPNPTVELFLLTLWSGGLKVKGLIAEPIGTKATAGFLYLRGGIKGVGMVRPSRIAEFADKGLSFSLRTTVGIVMERGMKIRWRRSKRCFCRC